MSSMILWFASCWACAKTACRCWGESWFNWAPRSAIVQTGGCKVLYSYDVQCIICWTRVVGSRSSPLYGAAFGWCRMQNFEMQTFGRCVPGVYDASLSVTFSWRIFERWGLTFCVRISKRETRTGEGCLRKSFFPLRTANINEDDWLFLTWLFAIILGDWHVHHTKYKKYNGNAYCYQVVKTIQPSGNHNKSKG